MSRNGSTKQKTRIIIDSKQQISGGIPGAQLSLEAQNASEPSVSLVISSGCPKSVRGVTSSLRKLPGLVWTAISIQWVCKMHQNAGYTMVSPWFPPDNQPLGHLMTSGHPDFQLEVGSVVGKHPVIAWLAFFLQQKSQALWDLAWNTQKKIRCWLEDHIMSTYHVRHVD